MMLNQQIFVTIHSQKYQVYQYPKISSRSYKPQNYLFDVLISFPSNLRTKLNVKGEFLLTTMSLTKQHAIYQFHKSHTGNLYF